MKCFFCDGQVPEDRYTMKMPINQTYCSEECKNRAATLRQAIINPKYLPKILNVIDICYIEKMKIRRDHCLSLTN